VPLPIPCVKPSDVVTASALNWRVLYHRDYQERDATRARAGSAE
jgi:hypothetical protein